MNTTDEKCGNEPIVKVLTAVTKRYVGVLRNKVKGAEDVDKYYYALYMIGNAQEPMNQNDLACAISQDKVSVVRIVDHLLNKKLISRSVDEIDRRKYNLSLTEKGLKVYPKIKQAIQETNKECVKGLSEAQIQSFLQCVQTMQDNLDQLPAEPIKLKFSNPTK